MAANEYETAGEWNFIIEQGTTFSRTFTYTDADSVAVNLTGYTVEMDIRDYPGASTAYVEASTVTGEFSLSDPTNGEFTLTLSATVTAALTFTQAVHDVKLTSSTGNVERLLYGKVVLSKKVT